MNQQNHNLNFKEEIMKLIKYFIILNFFISCSHYENNGELDFYASCSTPDRELSCRAIIQNDFPSSELPLKLVEWRMDGKVISDQLEFRIKIAEEKKYQLKVKLITKKNKVLKKNIESSKANFYTSLLRFDVDLSDPVYALFTLRSGALGPKYSPRDKKSEHWCDYAGFEATTKKAMVDHDHPLFIPIIDYQTTSFKISKEKLKGTDIQFFGGRDSKKRCIEQEFNIKIP